MEVTESEALAQIEYLSARMPGSIPARTAKFWAEDLVEEKVYLSDLRAAVKILPRRVPRVNYKALMDAVTEARALRFVNDRSIKPDDVPLPPRMSERDAKRCGSAAVILQAALRSCMRDPVTNEPHHPVFYDHGIPDEPDCIERLWRRCMDQDDETLQQWRKNAETTLAKMDARVTVRLRSPLEDLTRAGEHVQGATP